MIIFDGEKYSCVSCIRGHRSSTCKHSNRMLVKVRTRGRPSAQTVRKVILVDASSQVNSSPHTEEDDQGQSPCCSSSASRSCAKMNKQPILFLRTMSTQKALLVDGALKIMIEDTDPAFQGKYKFVSERDYLLNHLQIPLDDYSQETNGLAKNSVKEPSSLGNLLQSDTLLSNESQKHEYPDIKFEEQNRPSFLPIGKHTEQISTLDSEAHNTSMVELFTHKGVYLSTQCSCDEGNCSCVNCLIHRKEEELESYIQQSGVPLSTIGNGRITFPIEQSSKDAFVCKYSAEECPIQDCLLHPAEILSLNHIFIYGLINVPIKRKSVIKFKHKLIPSKFWWHLLKEELPNMPHEQSASFDIFQWFEHIIETFNAEIPNESDGSVNLHDMSMMMTS